MTGADVERAEATMGKAVPIFKGKMTRKRIQSSSPICRFPVPSKLIQYHPSDKLDIDFLYVQGELYLYTQSQHIKFQTIQTFNKISKRNKKTGRVTYKRGQTSIVAGIQKVIDTYQQRRFQISTINGDNEFTPLKEVISIPIHICAANQHIGGIERGIRTLKERIRRTWAPLPFAKAPKLMIDECIIDIISVMNDFPHNNGISQTISPAAIVLGRGKLNCSNHKVSFGAYCEVYIGTINDGN